jgi:hypothetical protein
MPGVTAGRRRVQIHTVTLQMCLVLQFRNISLALLKNTLEAIQASRKSSILKLVKRNRLQMETFRRNYSFNRHFKY